jgi:GNAT superfamily N-acetyltransferase
MQRAGVDVRDATAADAGAVASLMTALGYPASGALAAERLAAFGADPSSRVQVAEREGEVVGLVATHVVPRLDGDLVACRVVDIVVAAGARRAGIGRTLIRAAEAEAKRHGCRRLDLSSGDWRSEAHAFYEALGFERSALAFRKRLPEA